MAEENKQKLYAKYLGKMESLLDSKVTASIHEGFRKANTKVLRLSRYESSAFDVTWISVIEDILYDLGEIIKAPKLVTIEEGNLVPVELAKKIKGESVQHLASHTQYIKDIDPDNNVIPSKIMSFSNEDWLYTYENRFIATFIRRLMLFVEKRYQFVKAYIPLHKEEAMMIKSKARIDGADVEIESKIKVTKVSEDPEADAAAAAAERIDTVHTYLLYYYSSPFMQKMKTERDVRKPILMTNILRKNPKYHRCYETFLFIEKYDSLGMDYHSKEYFHPLTDEEGDNLSWLLYSQYLALNDDSDVSAFKCRKKDVHPKILSSIDDEEFLYGRIPSQHLEFVRADKEYLEYLEKRGGKPLPEHPKKPVALFYKEEYQDRKDAKEELRQIEKLLSRKEKALAKFELLVQEIIRQREEEEALLRQMEEEERLAAEEALLNKKRGEIEEAARGNATRKKAEESYRDEDSSDLSEDFILNIPAYTGEPMAVTFAEPTLDAKAPTFASPIYKTKRTQNEEERRAALIASIKQLQEEEPELFRELVGDVREEVGTAAVIAPKKDAAPVSAAPAKEASAEEVASTKEAAAAPKEAAPAGSAAPVASTAPAEEAEAAPVGSAAPSTSVAPVAQSGEEAEAAPIEEAASSKEPTVIEPASEKEAEAILSSEEAESPKEAVYTTGRDAKSVDTAIVLDGEKEGIETVPASEIPAETPSIAPRRVITLRHKGRFLRKKKEFREKKPVAPADAIPEEELIYVVGKPVEPVKPVEEEKAPETPVIEETVSEPVKEEEPIVSSEIPAEVTPSEEETPVEEALASEPLEAVEEPVEEVVPVEEETFPEAEPEPEPVFEEPVESIEEPVSEEAEPEEAEPEEVPAESPVEEISEEETPVEEAPEEPLEEEVEEPIEETPIEEEPVSESEEVEEPVEAEPEEEVLAESPFEEAPEEASEEPVIEEAPAEEIQEEPVEEPVSEPVAPEIPADAAPIEEEAPVEEAPIIAPIETTYIPHLSIRSDSNSGRARFVDSDGAFDSTTGRYIVKCPDGYYVADGIFTKEKSEAHVFLDFDKALKQKRRYGGKVVKL